MNDDRRPLRWLGWVFPLLVSAVLVLGTAGPAQARFYSLHVASFSDGEEAAQSVAYFRTLGLEAFVRYESVEGKGMQHRIFVGRMNSSQEAAQLAGDLKKKGVVSYAMVTAVDEPPNQPSVSAPMPTASPETLPRPQFDDPREASYRQQVYGGYVASFKYRELADLEAETLTRYGWPSTVVEAQVLETKWYRVYLLPPGEEGRLAAQRFESSPGSSAAGFEIIVDVGERSAAAVDRERILCGGDSNFGVKAALLTRLNGAIPGAGFLAALRQYGHKPAATRNDHTELVWGVRVYDRKDYGRAIDALRPAVSDSSLAWALAAADAELSAMPRRKVLIILADFQEERGRAEAAGRARELRRKYGADLCIHAIHFGGDEAAIRAARDVVGTGSCGAVWDGCRLLSDADYFDSAVRRMFHEEILRVARTIQGSGGADSDGDGVPDANDECPDTPVGAPVDARGCWVAAPSTLFDFDRAEVKAEYVDGLRRAADVLKGSLRGTLLIVGHTDNVGGEAYNLDLGRRRAEAVRRLLIRFGVDPDRMEVRSYGESQPVADNATEAGRARNRRVEIHTPAAPTRP